MEDKSQGRGSRSLYGPRAAVVFSWPPLSHWQSWSLVGTMGPWEGLGWPHCFPVPPMLSLLTKLEAELKGEYVALNMLTKKLNNHPREPAACGQPVCPSSSGLLSVSVTSKPHYRHLLALTL